MDDLELSRIEAALRDLSSDSPSTSRHAHQQLVDIGAPALPALVAALFDPDRRTTVLDVLQAMGPLALPALPTLLRVTRKDCDDVDLCYSEESAAALQALIAMGPGAVAPLLEGLRTAAEDDCRFYHVTLGQLPSDAVIPLLVDRLAEDHGEFRLRLLDLLGRFHAEAAPAIPQLVELLNHTAADIRDAAANALGRIGIPAVPALWRLADSPLVAEVVCSLRALGQIGEFSPEPIIHDGEHLWMLFQRKMAAPSMPEGDLMSERLQSRLPLLVARARPIQAAAAQALHRVVNSQVERTLSTVLPTPHAVVSKFDEAWSRAKLIHGLIGLHRPRGIDSFAARELWNLVSETSEGFAVQRAAATLLLDTRNAQYVEHVLPIVSNGLRDPEDAHYLTYMEAASRAGPLAAKLIPDILMQLKLTGTQRKLAALSALGRIGVPTPEVIEAVMGYLEHPNRRLANNATAVLGMFPSVPPAVVEALIHQLTRGWEESRVAVALGQLGPAAAAAVPALVAATHRTRERESWFVDAIGKIGTPEAIAALKTMYQQVTVNYDEWQTAGAHLARLGIVTDDRDELDDPSGTRPDLVTPTDSTMTGDTDTNPSGQTQ